MKLRPTSVRLLALVAAVVVVVLVLVGRGERGGAATRPAGRQGDVPHAAALDVRDRELTADQYDPDPAGTLRPEGQVIDAAGAPVGGATVTIDSRPPRSAKTEEDGSFAIDGLLAARYA